MPRSKRALTIVVVVVLIVALVISAVFVTGALGGSHRASAAQITQSWLNQELVQLKPEQNSTLGFSAFWPTASYGNINSVSPSNQQADLAMLVSSDASCIRIDPNYPPASPLTSDVQAVRKADRCLIFADAGEQAYYSSPIPWVQFQQAWIQRVTYFAATYKPDYYIVVKEPGWYVPMVSDATTNPDFQNASQWVVLTQELVSAVQQASPQTKIGVSIAADVGSEAPFYNAYLQGVERIPGISFIGFDIYNIPGFAFMSTFLSSYGTAGKSVWIAEAWSGTASVAVNSSRATLDKTWMLVLYYYAVRVHAANVIPFFTDLFSGYSKSPNYGQRTPVFYEFQTLASRYGVPLS